MSAADRNPKMSDVRSTLSVNDTDTTVAEEANRMSTPTITTPTPQQVAAPKITEDIRKRVVAIVDEMDNLILERSEVNKGIAVARIANQHFLMLGPGGTAKSLAVRDFVSRIQGATLFERALDESTDVSEVLGSPDIKAMVEDGKTRRVLTGTFAEATDAFLDEFFNSNGVVLHALMPGLNERIIHNNGYPVQVPLRSCYMGTNKLNADADQAALWDRVHHRHIVKYLADRRNVADMVAGAVARVALNGRGLATSLGQARTTVTLDEMDIATAESLALNVPQATLDTFLDIRDELIGNGFQVSDRRVTEGMLAVLANAWYNGHEDVKVSDLDVLQHMWWNLQTDAGKARAIILTATNPGEKAALDLLDDLDKIKAEVKNATSINDEDKKRRIGVEAVRNCDRLLREAAPLLEKANAAGASTTRLQQVISEADRLKVEVGTTVFNLDPNTVNRLATS